MLGGFSKILENGDSHIADLIITPMRYQTIRGCFPSMIIMQDDGEGGGSQVGDELDGFFIDGSVMDHSIEMLDLTNEET